MHPPSDPLILAGAAALLAAPGALLARWRDLSCLAVGAAGAASLLGPAAVAVPALALGAVGVVRGARRGVARPELTWIAGLIAAAAHSAVAFVPEAAAPVALGTLVVGGLLAALATTRRTTVRMRPIVSADVPITQPITQGPAR